MDLRCPGGKKFGEILESGVLEVKCNSPKCCGAEPGVVVLHRVDTTSGETISTRKYRNPPQREDKENQS